VSFDEDLIHNLRRHDAQSRFSQGFGEPLVETEVAARSRIGMANANKMGGGQSFANRPLPTIHSPLFSEEMFK
ncbi:MAG TPA: hypothetical protein VIC84_11750, partial [Blastocatellia bacterium]